MGELVQHGDPDLVLELGRIRERLDERQPEEDEAVGQRAGTVGPPGKRYGLVAPDQIAVLRARVLVRAHVTSKRLSEPGRP